MAAEQVQGGGSSEQELHREMEKLVMAFHEEDDRPELFHREELTELFRILERNKGAVSQLLPGDKDELAELLPKIGEALQWCKTAAGALPSEKKKKTSNKKKRAAVMSDCNPCGGGARPREDDEADNASEVRPLLEKTRKILGDAPAPAAAAADQQPEEEEEVLYEWTTSYVDESRIYGWDADAKEVADALAGPEKDDGGDVKFRAAGIAGIHGSGKTALAQKVFVHDRIKDTFPLRLWVCVGPPDHEDRAGLLYRMLDNLGLDTDKIEDVVNNSEAVKQKKNFDGSEREIERSKIGVLLFILHVTLAKTAYLIVFDDIRVYGEDGWYSNLSVPAPEEGEWSDRLAYGLPKLKKSAVLVTCRKEDDARTMVRTGRVFRPPHLAVDEGWLLFEREYKAAKEKNGGGQPKLEEDKLYKELELMKEQIVGKCLGLPVAIVEAAKGFADLHYSSDSDVDVNLN